LGANPAVLEAAFSFLTLFDSMKADLPIVCRAVGLVTAAFAMVGPTGDSCRNCRLFLPSGDFLVVQGILDLG
jgi:hypothetical protein